MINALRIGAAALAAALLFGPSAPAAQDEAPHAKVSDVSPQFRGAVAAMTRKGMQLVAVHETKLEDGQYLAATFAYPESDQKNAGNKALELFYAPAAGAAVPTSKLLYKDAYVDFGTYDDDKTVFADVNKDGKTDMIVSAGNGGNCWNCSVVALYTLEGGRANLLAAAPMALKDVDGDGILDLLVGDSRWEAYDDFSHAAAPGGTLVYVWKPGGYVFAGSDASAFYDSEIARIKKDLPDAISGMGTTDDDSFVDESYVGDAISLFLVYNYMGQAERGREEFRRMMGEHVVGPKARARRKRIMDDFLTGDSSRQIATPRKGDKLVSAMPQEGA